MLSPKDLKHNLYLIRERERERGGREGGRLPIGCMSPSEPNPNGMLSDKVVLREDWFLIVVVANHGSLFMMVVSYHGSILSWWSFMMVVSYHGGLLSG